MKAGKSDIRPISQFLFHKNLPPRDFSTMTLEEGVAAFVAGSKLPNAYAEKAFSTINFRPLTFDSPSKGQCMYGYVFRVKLGMDLESG